jgi:hypothetical protein
MTIRFECSQCGVAIKAPNHRGGAKLPCPKCGTQLVVPAAAPTTDEAAQFASLMAELESDKDEAPLPPPAVATEPVATSIDVESDATTTPPASSPVTHESAGKQQVRIVDIKLPFASVFRLALQFWAVGLVLSLVLWGLFILMAIVLRALGMGLAWP